MAQLHTDSRAMPFSTDYFFLPGTKDGTTAPKETRARMPLSPFRRNNEQHLQFASKPPVSVKVHGNTFMVDLI
jgi:hypothetical protein